jgi:hypothetical protein
VAKVEVEAEVEAETSPQILASKRQSRATRILCKQSGRAERHGSFASKAAEPSVNRLFNDQ